MVSHSSGNLIASTAESSTSAVSWGAIFAGAVTGAAVTLVLTLAGSGLGLTMISPFPNESASASTFAISAAVGLIIIQLLASAFGGYVAGRLRTKWSGLHNDEVFFRDTAHGILSWAIATLVAAGFLGSVISSTVGTGVQAVSSAAGAVTSTAATAATATAASSDRTDEAANYLVDRLMRPANPADPAQNANQDATAQVSRILWNGATTGSIPEGDRTYLAQLIAARTGLSEADANRRIDEVLKSAEDAKNKAQQAAETARKSSAMAALFGTISLLISAIAAGVAAVIGGRQRDDETMYIRM
ncbi:hypothetical protein BJF93_17745 [Xaviernesmea oryzae]|uniref:Uncharacterized protein n=1 Tax=Xaviernesmea oryzae TaxID=464029 RepID=A0A1Q9ATB6_9HYPH|nr:hypothetical protein [Xaviernesmea oryzae]OLP58674.1 hypothetical protein BJF93_17745 [Xaviernesmea oryzae]SEK67120.1 hypothetical protein SAMN04487976_103257 [Xaviernesmea oryzae]